MELSIPFDGFISTFLWSSLIGLISYQILRRWLRNSRMPPGPTGLPIIGQMVHLLNVDAISEFQKYQKKYGDIFSFSSGSFNVIVVNGYKRIQELSKRDEFCGRPDFPVWHARNFGKRNRGILFCDSNSVWQEQRRFALKGLRDFGFGKQSMEGMIIHELQELVKRLGTKIGEPVNLSGEFNASVLNSLWTLITGVRYDFDNPLFQEAINILIENVKGMELASPGLFFPYIVQLMGLFGKGKLAKGLEMRKKIRALVHKHIDEHVTTYNENDTRDFMDAYMHEIKKSSIGSSFHDDEGMLNLKVVMLDLFVAGAETTSTTLLWAVLFMTLHPETQKKVQNEIDAVVGRNTVSRDDKAKFVYLEAFLNEVHRKASLIPMSVFHKMQTDMEYEGFLFPKNAVVFLNIHEAHHDPQVWEDPHLFKPERFLDASGQLKKSNVLMPFGAGKRQCLGELLARDTLFIMLTGLLQNFSFKMHPDSKNMTDKGSSTFISSPEPFQVLITKRN